MKRQKLQIEVHSLEGSLKATKSEIKERSLGIVTTKLSDTVRKQNEARITELEANKDELEKDIVKIKAQITNPEEDRLSLEQFLNLSKNASTTVQLGNPVTKDAICRLIFLNFTAGINEMLSYQAKPPFDEMLKLRQSSTSRGERN